MDDAKFVNWKKSSRSSGGDNCVEIAVAANGAIGVRDSKNPDGGVLKFDARTWAEFLGGVRAGEFDL